MKNSMATHPALFAAEARTPTAVDAQNPIRYVIQRDVNIRPISNQATRLDSRNPITSETIVAVRQQRAI